MKRKYLLLGAFSLTIFLIGITYAWWNWTSEKTNINLTLNGLNVIYTGEDTVLKGPLYPTASMTNPDNIIHPFKLRTTDNIDVYGKISLEVLEFPDELKEWSFSWSLYKEDEEIARDSFVYAEVGKDIILSPYEQILTSDTSYTLYIWIDGEHYTNPLEMGSKDFKLKLKIDASQTPYTTPEECFSFNIDTGAITNYKCDGSTPVNEDTAIKTYKVLDVNACSNYLINIGYDETLASSLCSENIVQGYSISSFLTYEASSTQIVYMLNNNIIEPVIYDSTTYEMKDENACVTYLSNELSVSSDHATDWCSDDEAMKNDIHKFFSFKQVQYLINNNIINLEQVEILPKITDVVIPKTIGGVTVTEISNHYDETTEELIGAFQGKGLINVVIPHTVTYINSGAFDDNASYRYYGVCIVE